MNIFDWFCLSLVLIVFLIFSLWGQVLTNQKEHKFSWVDYILMGRRLTLPLFFLTTASTWYGGIIGVTQNTFEYGIYNFITQGIFWYLTYLIFALYIVDKVAHKKFLTLADYVRINIGPKSGKLCGLLNFMNVIPITYSISLGLIIHFFFESIDPFMGAVLGLIIVFAYSLKGGFKAVVYTDIIQFIFMFLAVLGIVIFSFTTYGGFSFLLENLPPKHLSLTGGKSLLEVFSWGLIALSTLVDPNFYQRIFASSEPQIAKKGIIYCTIFWLVFDVCTTLGALYARVVLPNHPPSTAYLSYGLEILPHGLKALFISGIIFTVVSTLDSYLFVSATTISYDLFPKKIKTSPQVRNFIGFFVSFFISVLAVYFAGTNIVNVWKILGSYSAACLLLPLSINFTFKNFFRDEEFVLTLAVSFIGMTIFYTFPMEYLKIIPPIYIGSLFSFLMCVFTYFKNHHRAS